MQNNRSKSMLRVRSGVRSGGVTIFGADWSAPTQRQKAAFDAMGVPYDYVNCDRETCPTIVRSFPTVTGYPGETDVWADIGHGGHIA
jgi:hypothetical protein